jgi:hypothetical protein
MHCNTMQYTVNNVNTKDESYSTNPATTLTINLESQLSANCANIQCALVVNSSEL